MLLNQGKMMLLAKVYYWNARLNGKTELLAGPFATVEEATAPAEIVTQVFLHNCPSATNASFGVVELKAPGAGPGRYNDVMPPAMIGTLLLSVGVPN